MEFKKPRKLLTDAVKYDLMVDLARMLLGSHTRIGTTNEKSAFSIFNRDRINVIPKTNEVYVLWTITFTLC